MQCGGKSVKEGDGIGGADNLELLAFNALPGALSKPIKQHVYYSRPNNVTSVLRKSGYGDDYLTPGATGLTPFVDGFGLDFSLADAPANHNAVQVYSDYYATGFTGAGTDDYGLSENTTPGFDGRGELILTPEPSSLVLLGSGFTFLALGILLRSRRSRS